MSTFDVLDRYGTAAFAKLVGAMALFLALHLIRMPLMVVIRVLDVAMRRVDSYATPKPPLTYPERFTTSREEGATHAQAA